MGKKEKSNWGLCSRIAIGVVATIALIGVIILFVLYFVHGPREIPYCAELLPESPPVNLTLLYPRVKVVFNQASLDVKIYDDSPSTSWDIRILSPSLTSYIPPDGQSIGLTFDSDGYLVGHWNTESYLINKVLYDPPAYQVILYKSGGAEKFSAPLLSVCTTK